MESTTRKRSGILSELSPLFSGVDLVMAAGILLLSITAARLPEVFDPDYPYPSSLFYVFTTLAQTLAPLVGIGLALVIYFKNQRGPQRGWEEGGDQNGKNEIDLTELQKGVIMMTITLLLSLIMLPLAELFYQMIGVRQGIMVGMILLSLWSIMTSILGGLRLSLSDPYR